ncbi:hypothetical protein [Parageobacillus thermoglucosidasius]|uniref:hypothetical protein n=1 Tax=Parageobacillus thermoglucosidasius TaxID=1426 RepID=UPI000E117BBB|nr:hypothetical protein [Parageobacillus thermoglucosidasius]MED4904533.1 hypothetical protein [Parageobacillus thermoglucosidasius]MED4913243.1 hypothetical protein [Parageobacillus thermoglucosidasius]MED4944165.1 hypothetical protein [Parageobacillus thermoglucosidasius]MED4984698.1 hypothetical protein [Parageobacillus thermoglucosidasius]RDE28497.1 hypothetical protein DV714_05050 [Parageobacillus thermoglucosidasius]
MDETVLQQVLDKLGNIEGTLHNLVEGQKRLEEEQLTIRKEQQIIRQEQQAIRQEQQTIRQEQQTIRREQQILLQGQKRLEEEQAFLQSGLKELNELMTALLHRQDETDAKLEAPATDVHIIHGEIASLKQGLHELEEKVDSHYHQLNERLDNIQLDVDFAVHKTTANERELYKIKNRLF